MNRGRYLSTHGLYLKFINSAHNSTSKRNTQPNFFLKMDKRLRYLKKKKTYRWLVGTGMDIQHH